MKDIGDHLGISKNAVSLALNGKPGVSKSLRDKIIPIETIRILLVIEKDNNRFDMYPPQEYVIKVFLTKNTTKSF